VIGFGVVVLHRQQSLATQPAGGQTLPSLVVSCSHGVLHANFAQVVGVVVGTGVVVAIKQQFLLSQPPLGFLPALSVRHSVFALVASAVHPG